MLYQDYAYVYFIFLNQVIALVWIWEKCYDRKYDQLL